MTESTSACVCSRHTIRPKSVYCWFLEVVSLLIVFIIMSTCVIKIKITRNLNWMIIYGWKIPWTNNWVLACDSTICSQTPYIRLSHINITYISKLNKLTMLQNNTWNTVFLSIYLYYPYLTSKTTRLWHLPPVVNYWP